MKLPHHRSSWCILNTHFGNSMHDARLKVDLIVVYTTPAALAAKSATSTIPILFATAIDPVGAGLADSLARPGGNVTGLSTLSTELTGKRFELLKELLPSLSHVAVLLNAANPANLLTLRYTEDAARGLHVALQPYQVRLPNDFSKGSQKYERNVRMHYWC
jgi:putative ABC transport system substrate-binding protein